MSLSSTDIWELLTFEFIVRNINSVWMNCTVELSESIWNLLRQNFGADKEKSWSVFNQGVMSGC